MNRKILLLALLAPLLHFKALSQKDWQLKAEKEGINIFTKTAPDSKFKAVRVICVLPATLSQVVAVLLDVNTGAQWLYSTKSSVLLKQVSPSELYYYSEVNVPWPVSNRDFIAHLKATQDQRTKVVTVYGPTVPDYIPVKKDIVRVAKSDGKWVLVPLDPGHVKVEYTIQVDPGGSIPAWLINLFATKGPYESFKKLKLQLQKPQYLNARLPFIIN